MINREQHFGDMAEGLEKGPMYVPPMEHRRPPLPLKQWMERPAQPLPEPFDRGIAYLRLHRGDWVKRSDIELQTPYVFPALDALVEDGRVVRLDIFNDRMEKDQLLYMPDKRKRFYEGNRP